MNPISSLQAAIGAAVTQIVALVVGFGVIDSSLEGIVINSAIAAINVGFLIANALHTHAPAGK